MGCSYKVGDYVYFKNLDDLKQGLKDLNADGWKATIFDGQKNIVKITGHTKEDIRCVPDIDVGRKGAYAGPGVADGYPDREH